MKDRGRYLPTTARLVILSTLYSAMSWAAPNQGAPPIVQPELDSGRDERAQHVAQAYKWKRDSDTLIAEVAWLTNHPDWADMAGIINTYHLIAYLYGKDSAILKTNVAMRLWEGKWGTAANDMFRRYVALVTAGRQLDVQRRNLHRKEVELIEGFHRERFKMLRALKDTAQRSQLGRTENDFRAQSLEDAAATYKSFGMGPLGLYERRVLTHYSRQSATR